MNQKTDLRNLVTVIQHTIDRIDRIEGYFDSRATCNEAQTRYSFIDPILRAMGWDLSNPDLCRPEYTLPGNIHVDYALFAHSSMEDFVNARAIPTILIESKALKHELYEEDGLQLQKYIDAEPRLTEGAAILTNGRVWLIHLLGDNLRLQHTPKTSVNLLRHSPDYIAEQLTLFAGYNQW